MTFKNKLSCSTLTDDQHKRIINITEYYLSVTDTRDELVDEYKRLLTFVYSMESMGFICPREREKYYFFITEKLDENLERIEKRS